MADDIATRTPDHSASNEHLNSDSDGSPDSRAARRRVGMKVGGLAILEQGTKGVTNLASIATIGRWCGTDDLGVFALGLTIVFLAQSIQEALITTPFTLFNIRYSDARKRSYRGTCLLCHLALAGTAMLSLLAGGVVLYCVAAPEWLVTIVLSTAFVVPAWLLRELVRRFALAEFDLRAALTISVLVAVVQLTLLVTILCSGYLSVATAFLSVFIGNGLVSAAWLWWQRSSITISASDFWPAVQQNWEQGKWLLSAQGVASISRNAVPWIVVGQLGTGATGVFAACDAVLRFANPVITALTNVFTPGVAHAFAEGGRERVRAFVGRMTLMLVAIMSVFCLIVTVCGDWLLLVVLSEQIPGAAQTLTILTLAMATARLALGPLHGLMALERADVCVRADALECIVTLTMALLLIGTWGITGVAVAVLCGGVTLSFAMTWAYLEVDTNLSKGSNATGRPQGGSQDGAQRPTTSTIVPCMPDLAGNCAVETDVAS